MPTITTKAEFAKHRGVSRAAVTQWGAAGRLALTPDGKVLVEESDAMLAASVNTRGGKGGTEQNGAKTVAGAMHGEPAAADPSAPAATQHAPGAGSLTDARTHQARAKAKLDDLEYRQRVGELVEKSRVERAIADGLGAVLSKLDSLATRAAPKLIGLAEVRPIQDVIDDEVAALRKEIADTLRSLISNPTEVATRQ